MPTSEIAMTANVQIGHVIAEAGPWPRGTLALYDLVLVFAANDRAQPITLALTDIRRASLTPSAAADEIQIKTYGGPAWAIRVRSGMALITALRLRGVAVGEAR